MILCSRGAAMIEGLSEQTFIIGSGPNCHHRITGDPYVSAAHAAVTINRVSDTIWIADLGSTNGTYITRRGIQTFRVTKPTQLQPDDIITVGRTKLPWNPR